MALRHVIQYHAGDELWRDGPIYDSYEIAKMSLKQIRSMMTEGSIIPCQARLITMDTSND